MYVAHLPVSPSSAQPSDSSAQHVSSTLSTPVNPNDLPIALRKVPRSCYWVFMVKYLPEAIEVDRLKERISLSQWKYVLDILEDSGLMGVKPIETPMDPNVRLCVDQGELLSPDSYRKLVRKLNYLTITHPDIAFVESRQLPKIRLCNLQNYTTSSDKLQMDRCHPFGDGTGACPKCFRIGDPLPFMSSTRSTHMEVALRIVRYLKFHPGHDLFYRVHSHLHVGAFTDADWLGSPSDRRPTTRYCTFLCGNLVTWKSKKQIVVVRSSAKAEYRVLTHTSCELLWLKHFLKESMFEVPLPMSIYCDNQVGIHISSNPVFHERTKHIEVDCHIIRERVEKGVMVTPFVSTNAQLANIFTKPLFKPRLEFLYSKLGLCDIYSLA
ncbi:hypothetical protein Acr_11g0007530 [Actinidia rufa]|uniref:Retrovirus-related Pol polyprotein from transposon RE1 n=1 Tax=Actinidia rufa TaxID=165716 RepID=A0A7J0FEX2_9ERIC|nr:hypothetical protein Acr_11g0007530 [Actinidia rufa]